VLVKRALFLLNAAIAIAILHLISQVHLLSFVKMLPKYLKESTWSYNSKNVNLSIVYPKQATKAQNERTGIPLLFL
jgi:hypothetical protein